MKILALIAGIFIIFNLLIGPILAQEFNEDFGVSKVGFLPNQRFYFLKILFQAFKKLLTFNSINKTELELDILNIKIAELKKIYDSDPNNITLISLALKNYQKAADVFKDQIKSLKDHNQSSEFNALINKSIDKLLKHQQFFDNLRIRSEFYFDLKLELDEAQKISTEILTIIPKELEDILKFKNHLKDSIDNQNSEFKELRMAEILDRLEGELNLPAREEILRLKEDLLIKFSGRLEGQSLLSLDHAILPVLEQVPGDQLRRLKILDEVREIVVNPDLKSQLNIVRQRILEKALAIGAINSEKAEQALSVAEELLKEVQENISKKEGDVSHGIEQLVDRAEFNLQQVSSLFIQGNYGGAYGQATAAVAALKNALTQMSTTIQDYPQDLIALKNKFDQLLDYTKELNLTEKDSPKLFNLFKEAEKKINELSRLINKPSNSEKIIPYFKNIKLILSTIEEIIKISQ